MGKNAVLGKLLCVHMFRTCAKGNLTQSARKNFIINEPHRFDEICHFVEGKTCTDRFFNNTKA